MRIRPLFLAFCVVVTSPAAAQPRPNTGSGSSPTATTVSADSAATAEALFNEGRALIDKGNFAEACPKFAESQRLDPGSGTLMNLGDCYERIGKFSSAWATYREASFEANKVGNKKRESDAKLLSDRVEPKLSRLQIKVPPSVASLPNLQIKRDDILVARAQWGTLLPIDAGEHRIIAEAPGYDPWSKKLTIDVAKNQEITIPDLLRTPEPIEIDSGKDQRVLGYGIGGLGIASMVVGGVFGIEAISQKNRADCDSTGCADQAARDLNNSAIHSANVSSILVIAGGAATVAGVLLVLTAPGKTKQSPAAAGPLRSKQGGMLEAPPCAPRLSAGVRGPAVVVEGRF